MTRRAVQLGEPVELPWWVVPLGLPPALTALGGIVVGAPIAARLVDLIASVLLLWLILTVARRVASRNMQSVWISAAYALWFFAMLVWAVQAFGPSS